MSRYESPSQGSFRLPSVGRRVLGGALLAIALLFFYIGLPFGVVRALQGVGIPFPYSILTLSEIGIALTALGVARYLAKPTRWFGPASIIYSLAVLAYLVWIASQSTIHVSFMGASVTLDYARLILVFTIAPLLSIASGVVTTAEDALRPRERYPFDFPS